MVLVFNVSVQYFVYKGLVVKSTLELTAMFRFVCSSKITEVWKAMICISIIQCGIEGLEHDPVWT